MQRKLGKMALGLAVCFLPLAAASAAEKTASFPAAEATTTLSEPTSSADQPSQPSASAPSSEPPSPEPTAEPVPSASSSQAPEPTAEPSPNPAPSSGEVTPPPEPSSSNSLITSAAANIDQPDPSTSVSSAANAQSQAQPLPSSSGPDQGETEQEGQGNRGQTSDDLTAQQDETSSSSATVNTGAEESRLGQFSGHNWLNNGRVDTEQSWIDDFLNRDDTRLSARSTADSIGVTGAEAQEHKSRAATTGSIRELGQAIISGKYPLVFFTLVGLGVIAYTTYRFYRDSSKKAD